MLILFLAHEAKTVFSNFSNLTFPVFKPSTIEIKDPIVSAADHFVQSPLTYFIFNFSVKGLLMNTKPHQGKAKPTPLGLDLFKYIRSILYNLGLVD